MSHVTSHATWHFYSGGSWSEISLEMEFLWQFFFSKSGLWHPKNGTKLKFNKKSLRKHAPKFQFPCGNSWVRYITFSVYQAFSCLTKCVILLLDMVLISNNRFLGMGNHLGPFSEAPDRPEGQELGGGAVGGQEVLQEVKF